MTPPGHDDERGPASDATATGVHGQADIPVGSVIGERYRIESILGIGGMGVVYRATDLALGVPVALKLLRPELAHRADAFERFRQELLLARQVSSPRVVRIHDLARHDQRWLISMDLIDGQSLDQRLDQAGALPIDDAVRIARQIAEGLAAAHAREVVHRDLKPANILLDAQGDAYISDFGVARSLATSGNTRTGMVVGTPDYLAPEQARGEHADARSDLYALGLILHEMLAGQPPFAGGTVAEVLAQRMLRAPEPVTARRGDTPRWLARLVDRLLRPQPAHRMQTAREVITAIDTREVPRRWADMFARHRGAWMASAIVLLLAAGGAAWWHWRAHLPLLVASPPLDRLLVLPIEPGGAPGARVAALSAQLRDALAQVPGYAVVDGDRTVQAVRQLDPDGNARLDPGALQRVAAAQRVLQLALRNSQGHWQLLATLDAEGQPPRALPGPQASDAVGAVQAWLSQPVVLDALGLQGRTLALASPRPLSALDSYGAALIARREGRLADALAGFKAATSAAPAYATAWLAQADTALMIGEQDAASDAIEQGQRVAATSPLPLRERFAALRAGIEGDAPAAVDQWRALVAATPDDTEAALNLARARGAGGDFATAVKELLALSQRDGNDPRIWFELGKFSILSGDAQRAVDDYLVRALVQYKRSRDLFGEGETVNALGIGYGRLGQSDDAAEQYAKAVQLRHAVGNVRGEATSLRNLGNALSLTGKYDDAQADLLQARALYTRLGDRDGLAAVENDLGLLAEERGNYPQALQAFQRALQSWQDVGDAFGSAQALNDIGFAQYQLGAYNDAQVYLQQAAAAYEKLGDETGRVRSDQDLGLLAIARGRWEEARRRLQQSLAAAERQQMPEEAAVSRRHLAELELRQGHLQAAIDQAGKAEASFRSRDDARGASDAGLLHVEALVAAHALPEARTALAALATPLADAPSEQRATAHLLDAEIALDAGDRLRAVQALHDARQAATGSGIRQLLLRIELLQARVDGTLAPALGEAIASLGHIGLRLQWLQLAMQLALSSQDAARAAELYNEAAALLRNGDALQAPALHALGARARAGLGDAAGARAATLRAQEAAARLRSSLPPALRSRFDAANALPATTAPGAAATAASRTATTVRAQAPTR
jgi:tetratricopeptide (TPR) repeat protein